MFKAINVIALLILLAVSSVQAQTWTSLQAQGNATYIGGYYAAVSYGCLGTNYTNDSGLWASGPATIPYEKGCARTVYDAMFGNVVAPRE